jgi:hypothetical protein
LLVTPKNDIRGVSIDFATDTLTPAGSSPSAATREADTVPPLNRSAAMVAAEACSDEHMAPDGLFAHWKAR